MIYLGILLFNADSTARWVLAIFQRVFFCRVLCIPLQMAEVETSLTFLISLSFILQLIHAIFISIGCQRGICSYMLASTWSASPHCDFFICLLYFFCSVVKKSKSRISSVAFCFSSLQKLCHVDCSLAHFEALVSVFLLFSVRGTRRQIGFSVLPGPSAGLISTATGRTLVLLARFCPSSIVWGSLCTFATFCLLFPFLFTICHTVFPNLHPLFSVSCSTGID